MDKYFKNKYLWTFLVFLLLQSKGQSQAQNIIRYDLYVGEKMVNFTGKNVTAMVINNQLPAPTLTFTEGDIAEIYVHNTLREETMLHWHGLLLPNRYDGVPYLTTAPIQPGETKLFTFALIQSGTYWYHSHTGMQEQKGMYGALVVHKKQDDPTIRSQDKLPEYVLLLSDWTNEDPKQIHRSLHHATDWYAIKKGATQNYGEALRKGHLKTKLVNEWKRMLAMDVSDVYYERFLANGQPEQNVPQFKAGDQVRVRIINGSASTYFWLEYAGGKMTVVASDGKDVEPVGVDRMIIAVAETYDIVLNIPENKRYELKATSEDRTNFVSLFLGNGETIQQPALPKLKYFEGMKMMNSMMRLDGSMDDMGMNMSLQQMDMNTVMYPEVSGYEEGKQDSSHYLIPDDFIVLNYAMLRSTTETTLPAGPIRTLRFELTGNMNRYVWTLNNRTVSESDVIEIKQGENIRIELYNGSMMRHPMHLHGHFFRVINGQKAYAPLKNVIDIMPMETNIIEFAANDKNGGDWFFHCHILYHMMAGMGRIFRYENSPPNPEAPDPQKALRKVYRDDRQFHGMIHAGLQTNGSEGMLGLGNTRWTFGMHWHVGWRNHQKVEVETHVGRFIDRNQFLIPYVGIDFPSRTHASEKDWLGQSLTHEKTRMVAGFRYVLPLFLELDARMDHTGRVRMKLSREDLAFSNRGRLGMSITSEREYQLGVHYILTKKLALSASYHNEMGWGAGLAFTY
ncbi:MAG TPA: copper oxidase [Bacteroidetes bacterium]|nr:copper oxidase [Bacteroidota bacterium]